MVITVGHLVRTAPDDIEISEEALDQTVGWLIRAQRPASLREFVAAQAPRRVMASLDVSPSDAPGEPVKRVTELNESELQRVVVAVLREAPPDSVMAIVGEGAYSPESLVRHVEADTPLGRELTAATARHIELLEGLIEAGKIKGLSHQESDPDMEINLHF